MAVFIFPDEESFVCLHERNVVECFIKILKQMVQNIGATPEVGYVRFMASALGHIPGCLWMISTSYWSEIIGLTIRAQDRSDLKTAGVQFITKLIERSVLVKSDFCSKILYLLISPIASFRSLMRNKNNFDEEFFKQNCFPNLCIFEAVLETTVALRNHDVYAEVTQVTETNGFYKYSIEICLLMRNSNEEITFKFVNVLSLLSFFNSLHRTRNIEILRYEELITISEKYDIMFKNKLMKSAEWYSNLTFNMIKYFNVVRDLVPRIRINDSIVVNVDDTLVDLQLIPIIFVSLKLNGSPDEYMESEDELRNSILERVLKKALPIVVYYYYRYRDCAEDSFTFEYPILALKFIQNSKAYYTKEQANTILSILVFCYEDIYKIATENYAVLMSYPLQMDYMAYLMDSIAFIISEFNLNWQDIMSSMILMEMTLAIVSLAGWSQIVSCRFG